MFPWDRWDCSTAKVLLPDLTRGSDILWRSDEPKNGRALASGLILPAAARSTAVLNLPAGAKVLYARLYWAAQRLPLLGPGKTVVVERPGKFSTQVNADALRGSSVFPLALIAYYQSSADITSLVQVAGQRRLSHQPASTPWVSASSSSTRCSSAGR